VTISCPQTRDTTSNYFSTIASTSNCFCSPDVSNSHISSSRVSFIVCVFAACLHSKFVTHWTRERENIYVCMSYWTFLFGVLMWRVYKENSIHTIGGWWSVYSCLHCLFCTQSFHWLSDDMFSYGWISMSLSRVSLESTVPMSFPLHKVVIG
jgi:hypothetical protein